jgi:hypothetical protein
MISSAVYRFRAMPPPFVDWNPHSRADLVYRGQVSFVSHVTGFGTQIGIALLHNHYDFSIELLVIPITFNGGAV